MASNFSVRGTFDGSELIQGFKDSKKSLQDMGKQADDTQKKLSEMLQQKNSTSNYRQQLAKIQKELTDLVVNYRLLSDADKQTEFGVTMSKRIDELTQKASMLKDAVLDVQQEISKGASDTAGWDALASAIDITGSSIESFMGLTGMSKDSAEALVKVLTQMKTIEASVNSVIKVGNALQKQSALMIGISTVQKKAAAMAAKMNAAATTTEATATKGATMAQAAFNLVAKANPYVLLASAVVAVGAALFKFASKSKDATDEQKELNDEIEKNKQRMKEYADAIGSATGKAAYSFDRLSSSFAALTTDSEKLNFLQSYAGELNSLGIELNNVADAEEVLIRKKDKFREAVLAKAEAAALEKLIEKAYEDYYTKIQTTPVLYGGYKAGDTVNNKTNPYFNQLGYGALQPGSEWNNMGASGGKLTEEGARQLNQLAQDAVKAPLLEALDATVNQLKAAQDSARTKMAPLLQFAPLSGGSSSSSSSSSSSTTTTKVAPEDIYGEKSLRAAQMVVTELQDKLNRMNTDDEAFAATKDALEEAKQKVVEIQNLMKGPEAVAAAKSIVEQYDDLVTDINLIKKKFDIGLIDEDTAKSEVEEINNKIRELGAKPVEIEWKVKGPDPKTFEDTISEFSSGISAMSNFVGGIDNVVTSFSKLKDNMDEAENGWEKFMVAFEAGMSVLNAVTTIMETINTLTAAYNAISTIFTANKTAEAAAATADAAAQTTDAAAASANAAAHAGGAVAAGTESVAKIPYVGGFLAIGVAAALIAALVAGLASFANGGIVGGPSKIGDMNIARLNDGEIVMNGSQQRRLWDFLNGKDGRINNGSSQGGEVSFRISGDSLVGTIDNYNKKKGRR